MNISEKTIKDFGIQWTVYNDTSGFFGSDKLLSDFIAPFNVNDFKGCKVADIGAGTGRFVLALLEMGAEKVIAVEPSDAAEVIKEKTKALSEKVTILKITGDKIPADSALDYIISVGVIHHIPQPLPVIEAAYHALKPGGKLIIWLYGKEGNCLYLFFLFPIRLLSKYLSHQSKAILSNVLNIPLSIYIILCKKFSFFPFPLKDYMINILGCLPSEKRKLVIYDQLNPEYAKYYKKNEALSLMKSMPFDVEIYHRRGYSWVVIGTKPPI